MKSLRILLADDHTIVRGGLRVLLEREPDFTVTAEASDGRQAIDLIRASPPDVAVLDIAMPNLNGIEAARHIASHYPRTAIVVLSMHSDEAYLLRALKAGARGYLLKDAPETDLVAAIRAVHAGKAFFSPAISRMLVADYVHQLRQREVEDSYDLLTPREREILQLLAEGRAGKEIAARLNLSLYTVETHRGNILRKLNLHGTPELILYAVRKGVIS